MTSFSPAEWVVVVIFLFIAFRYIRPVIEGFGEGISGETGGKMICPACGSRGHSETITRGSGAIELVLWLCLLIPGLIYSIWRLTTRYPICSHCKQPGVIPVATPKGTEIAARFVAKEAPPNEERTPCPQCKEMIMRGAKVCRFCGVKFET